jgi:hypothetical protein
LEQKGQLFYFIFQERLLQRAMDIPNILNCAVLLCYSPVRLSYGNLCFSKPVLPFGPEKDLKSKTVF